MEETEKKLAWLRERSDFYFDQFLESGSYPTLQEFWMTLCLNAIRKIGQGKDKLNGLKSQLEDMKVIKKNQSKTSITTGGFVQKVLLLQNKIIDMNTSTEKFDALEIKSTI